MIAYNCTYKKNSYIIAHIKKNYKSDMLQEVIGNKIDILLISGTNLFRLDITQHVWGVMFFIREDLPPKRLIYAFNLRSKNGLLQVLISYIQNDLVQLSKKVWFLLFQIRELYYSEWS